MSQPFELHPKLTLIALCLFFGACNAPEATSARERAASNAAVALDVPTRAWEHETSDIPLDPRVQFGRFENGLRWAWGLGREPRDRSYLRLHVNAGSLAEEEHERGMAHFLEHMAFNGSEHFAPGTLIEWFQSHGMAFGADTNAYTSFGETVYQLDLPLSDEATLREALVVMRDFADRLLLSAEEVEAEKGVIDGEQRESDSAGRRVFEKLLGELLEGTRYPERLPIGLQGTRAAFTAETVEAFYRRWYRPQNMTLALVGDLGELNPVPLFEEAFASMPVGDGAWEAEPALGRPRRFDTFFAISEDEIPVVRISIQRLANWEYEPVTVASWTEDVPLAYARSMLNLRFSELAKLKDAKFLDAGASSAEMLDVLDGESLEIISAPDGWRDALLSCVLELRRALEFGFQPAELEEVRADALRSLDEGVEREATQHSLALLRQILEAAESPFVPTDAHTDREVLRPVIQALTPELCHAAFVEAWSRGEISIGVTGSIELEDPEAELRAAWDEAFRMDVDAGEMIASLEFAYSTDPDELGTIASREYVEDFDFHMIRFANGVALNVKRTDFKEKQLLVSARFGEGRLSLAPEAAVQEWVVGRVFHGFGLGAHDTDDLRRLTAGRTVGTGFSVGLEEFVLSGSTTAEDLELQCNLLRAQFADPAWRDEGWLELERQVPLLFEGIRHQHQGPIVMEFLPALFSFDPRFDHPSQEAILECGIAPLEAWLAPQFADAPIELSLVGDLDVEASIEIVARTLGSLPPRRALRAHADRRTAPAPLAGLRQEHRIETEVRKSLVLIVFPTEDGILVERRRLIEVLNSVVNDRLRIEVREALGASYSPGSGIQISTVYPGVGMLVMQAMSDPDKVDTLVEACLAVGDSLALEGLTDEEVNRLREPIQKRRRDALRTNSHWLGVLSNAQRKPEHVEEYRSADAFYAGYSAEDLAPLAARYLTRDRASVLVVHPESSAPPAAGGDED